MVTCNTCQEVEGLHSGDTAAKPEMTVGDGVKTFVSSKPLGVSNNRDIFQSLGATKPDIVNKMFLLFPAAFFRTKPDIKILNYFTINSMNALLSLLALAVF